MGSMSPEIDYRAIRQRVEQQTRKEKMWLRLFLLALTIIIFIIFAVSSWQSFNDGVLPPLEEWNFRDQASTIDAQTSAMMMMTVGWLLAILFQAISLVIDTRFGENSLRERIMGREVNKEIMRLGMDSDEQKEKAKHVMRLSDDGEMEEVVEEAILESDIKQNHSR